MELEAPPRVGRARRPDDQHLHPLFDYLFWLLGLFLSFFSLLGHFLDIPRAGTVKPREGREGVGEKGRVYIRGLTLRRFPFRVEAAGFSVERLVRSWGWG